MAAEIMSTTKVLFKQVADPALSLTMFSDMFPIRVAQVRLQIILSPVTTTGEMFPIFILSTHHSNDVQCSVYIMILWIS